ncbi:uncharacterized protein LOC119321490 [Triticum dicoccoides]|uniref:uncharacterized protein LOC119321490 n=1 Tax=Triticum dicoccoides TaxID=85692 RepID=UPI0018911BD6|nr:uncharacterized protein LOC119321490 [Triticum dicoccoides]
MLLDQATQKHRSFGFGTFLEREDAAAAMDNMNGAELFGRVLPVNYAFPRKSRKESRDGPRSQRFFYVAIDKICAEMDHRFSEGANEIYHDDFSSDDRGTIRGKFLTYIIQFDREDG